MKIELLLILGRRQKNSSSVTALKKVIYDNRTVAGNNKTYGRQNVKAPVPILVFFANETRCKLFVNVCYFHNDFGQNQGRGAGGCTPSPEVLVFLCISILSITCLYGGAPHLLNGAPSPEIHSALLDD